ncbi:unnamed protein product [Polarella glacialis]|uniref:Uncharacterized protein n=1 Tax=Polarella glacialis TaxID=89957 RepID=A0A813GXY0_POLGL|nr:unnamed protein product [Polarella glacialis]
MFVWYALALVVLLSSGGQWRPRLRSGRLGHHAPWWSDAVSAALGRDRRLSLADQAEVAKQAYQDYRRAVQLARRIHFEAGPTRSSAGKVAHEVVAARADRAGGTVRASLAVVDPATGALVQGDAALSAWGAFWHQHFAGCLPAVAGQPPVAEPAVDDAGGGGADSDGDSSVSSAGDRLLRAEEALSYPEVAPGRAQEAPVAAAHFTSLDAWLGVDTAAAQADGEFRRQVETDVAAWSAAARASRREGSDCLFLHDDLVAAQARIRVWSGQGPDVVPNAALKAKAAGWMAALLALFNLFLALAVTPGQWRRALVAGLMKRRPGAQSKSTF